MPDNKGQIRMLETFLAVLVIFSASIISITSSPRQSLEREKLLATSGMQTLIELDSDSTLGRLIDERNWTVITTNLKTLLPIGVSYNVTIYDETMRQINNLTLGTGLSGQIVVSIEYPCASQSPNCRLYLIRLQLAFAR